MSGVVRVLVDGPLAADPATLGCAVAARLRDRGRPSVHLAASDFWRDASVRLEFGHTDLDAYYQGWLDAPALRREVLDALVQDARYLPTLRDPATNRATRAAYEHAPADLVLLVSGDLLLGQGLPAELSVHLQMDAPARARRTPPEWAWTLPALERYDAEVDPGAVADVVVRVNDPNHPAMAVRDTR